jgi:Glycoside hydrolase family 44
MNAFSRRHVQPKPLWLAATVLLAGLAIATAGAQSAITIAVDAAANRHPINPNIYGVAHATTAQLNDLNSPLNRNGGNNTTRYNWQQNADNRGSDWYFQSIADASATPGERGDTFIANALAANAQAMLTIPLIDWVAKVGPSRGKLASFSIAKYGPQSGADWEWMPDAGNGIRTSGQNVTGNDPADANVPSLPTASRGWLTSVSVAMASQRRCRRRASRCSSCRAPEARHRCRSRQLISRSSDRLQTGSSQHEGLALLRFVLEFVTRRS